MIDPDATEEKRRVVEHLTARLKKLRDDMKEFNGGEHVVGSAIPPHLREEISKIYDQHGGIAILAQVAKVPYNTIKIWHSKFKRNPLYFQHLSPCARFYRRPPFTNPLDRDAIEPAIRSATQEQRDPKEQQKIAQRFKSAKTAEDFQRLLPPEVFERILSIKKSVEEIVGSGPKRISQQLKEEIARLVVLAGSARPVAILLGLNERVLMSWRDYLVGEISKVPSAYKLN